MSDSTQPNIILINCDDLGFGDLSCYGSARNDTPNIDRLAREGTRFTDFYVASPVCTPSRAALLTGCYPPRISFDDFDGQGVLFPGRAYGIHQDELTLGQLMQHAGYATKLIGKWHVGDQAEFLPTRRGFDEYYGLPYSNDMGRQRGREDSPPLPLIENEDVIQQQPDQRALTERYTQEALRFIRRHSDMPAADNGNAHAVEPSPPFFLYFAHMYVHVPLFVPEVFLQRSRNGAYGGAVAAIDWSLGVLLDELDERGIAENTMIIFTSDNGSRARDEGGSNAPFRGVKGSTWEGGMRVPFIVRRPGYVPANETSDALLSGMDILPTLASIAGVDLTALADLDARPIDGVNAEPLLRDPRTTSPRRELLYYRGSTLEAIRYDNWKLRFAVAKTGGPGDPEPVAAAGPSGSASAVNTEDALYDLVGDPGETRNLAGEHPEVLADLRRRADEARRRFGDAATGHTGSEVRPKGRVENPKTLTEYNPQHPYMIAMYDLADGPVMAG